MKFWDFWDFPILCRIGRLKKKLFVRKPYPQKKKTTTKNFGLLTFYWFDGVTFSHVDLDIIIEKKPSETDQ